MVAWKVVKFCRNSETQSNIILEGDALEIVHVCYELKDNLKVRWYESIIDNSRTMFNTLQSWYVKQVKRKVNITAH